MDNDLDPAQNKTLERALMRLFVKGSEGDGALRLNEAETHALAEYVRHLRSQFVQQQQPVDACPKTAGTALGHFDLVQRVKNEKRWLSAASLLTDGPYRT